MRDYKIYKEMRDVMWTCKITDRYGNQSTNYFETEEEASAHVDWMFTGGEDMLKRLREDDALLAKAVKACVDKSSFSGDRDGLD